MPKLKADMMIDVQSQARAIAERLENVRERVVRACQRSGRRADEITVVGVTKKFPVEVVTAAREAGLRDFGENRAQELISKAQALPGAVQGGTIRWHMIGHLQRNKARDVVACADVFHALDSLRLADTLEQRAAEAGRVVPCFVQVNVSGEASKFGLDPGEAAEVVRRLAEYEHLRVVGLMTLASPIADPEDVRPQFRRLRTLFETCSSYAPMTSLSMGMSGDFDVAIEEGATHVRLGTILFGRRPV